MVSLISVPIPDFSQKSFFNKCLQVSIGPPSFYISFIYSVLFSISKHRKSDLGKSLYTTLYTYLSNSRACTYLLNLANRFKSFDESPSSENLSHLIKTEGAIAQLLGSSVQLCKILTNSSGSDIDSITSSHNSSQLEMISIGLNVTLAIFTKNEVKYWNRKNGNLMIWTYEENSSHYVILPCLGLADNEFPFIYQEVKNQIFEYSREKCEISNEFDWVHLKFTGLDATVENYLGLATAMIFVFGKKEIKENCHYFVNKFKEIVENIGDGQENETLTFFIRYFEYLMTSEGDFDVFWYLDNAKEHLWYLANALKIAGEKLLLTRINSVGQNFIETLNVFSQVSNISFAIYNQIDLITIKTYFKKQEVWIYLREFERQYLPVLYLNKIEANILSDAPSIIVQSTVFTDEDSYDSLKLSINPMQSEIFPDSDNSINENLQELDSSPIPTIAAQASFEPLTQVTNPYNTSSIKSIRPHQPNLEAKVQPPALLSSSKLKTSDLPTKSPPLLLNPKVQIESSNPADVSSHNPSYPNPLNQIPSINLPEITSDLMTLFKSNYSLLKPKLQSLTEIQDIYNSITSKPISSSQALLSHFYTTECNNVQHLQKFFSLQCTHTFCIECLYESLEKISFYSCPHCKIFLKEKTKKKVYAEITKLHRINLPKVKKSGAIRNLGNTPMKKCILCGLQLMNSEFNQEKCKFQCCVCNGCRRRSEDCLNCREIEKKILDEGKQETEICAVCNELKEIESFQVMPCKNQCRVCWQCRSKESECSICKINEEDDKSMLITIDKRRNEDESFACLYCNKTYKPEFFPDYCKSCFICIFCALNTEKCIKCSSTKIIKYKNRCAACSKDIKNDELEILRCHHYYHKKCTSGKKNKCYSCNHKFSQSEPPTIP